MANISIKEGDISKQLGHINKLKISNQGGGTSLWVPEDDVQTKSLFVDENGVYEASKDDCYGYDEVSVNITKEVFGYEYDDFGDIEGFYDIEVDDDDWLEETELPTYIKIIQPPDKVDYITAEPINTAGMVVMGYYADDSEYGEIPREEYTIDPLVATGGGGESGEIDVTGTGLNAPVYLVKMTKGMRFNNLYVTNVSGEVYGINSYTGTTASAIVSYTQGATLTIAREGGAYPETFVAGNKYTNEEKTCYFSSPAGFFGKTTTDVPFSAPTNSSIGLDGAIALLGGKWKDSQCVVTVSWIRPEDEEELTDEFEVTVHDPTPVPPIGDDSGGGGSSGGSW